MPDQQWPAAQVQRIHERLIELGNPERAAWDRDYLHSERVHLGVAIPNIRKTVREFQRELGRKRPALVRGFLDTHLDSLAGLSVREAIKPLPAAERVVILAKRSRSKPGS